MLARVRLVLLIALALLAAVYVCDYASLRFLIPKRQPFGSVMVVRSYAVALKDRQTEYMFDPPTAQTCVNSLFPHFGDTPCWYLSRHPRQQIKVGEAPKSIY
jgi:hypothetical protein